jgi:hypothetical protein
MDQKVHGISVHNLIISLLRLGNPLRKEAMIGTWSAYEPSISRIKWCSFLKTIEKSFCVKKICGNKKPKVIEKNKTNRNGNE